MSNETDLDWLARNVHKFGDGCNYICLDHNDWQPVMSATNKTAARWFTKDEWLAHRAELQNKPSWDRAGSEYTHLVQTADGSWAFTVDPEIRCEKVLSDSFDFLGPEGFMGEVLGDWRDTLEKRPDMYKNHEKIDKSVGHTQKEEKPMHDWYERGELPPVGVVCEAQCKNVHYARCEILGHHNGQIAVRWFERDGGCLDVFELESGWSFRPISTEREELINIIVSHGLINTGDIADAILKAGFKRTNHDGN